MKQGWEAKKLGEIAKINYGYTEKAFFDKIGPKFLRITDIRDGGVDWMSVPYCKCSDSDLSKYKLEEADIVFARTGATTGKSYLIKSPPDAVFASYLIRLKLISKKDFSPEFVSYYFQTKFYWDKINSGISGSAQGGFNATKLGELNFPIPPIPEQNRIVAILDKAFTTIAKAKANAEQNLKNTKELFENYLQGVFENKGDDWEEKTLGEVCVKIQDGAHHSPKILYPERGKGLFPYITSKNIKNSYMDLSKLSFVDEKFHMSIYPRCKAEIGDVLLTKDGAKTGNITLNTLGEPFSLLSSVCLIKPYRNKLQPEFLKFYIQSPMGFKSITGKMTGAAIKRIILRAIKSATILLPPLKEQQTIVKNLDALSAETKKLEAIYQKKIKDLEELKKSILQKAFNGELVLDVELDKVSGISTTDLHIGIIGLAYQKHQEAEKLNTFRHVKVEKISHLIESYVGIDLDRTAVKDAAGPNDFKHLKKVEHRAKMAGFFNVVNQINDYQYQPQKGLNSIIDKTKQKLNAAQLDKINNLLGYMVGMATRQAEIFATVFAAWNNLLIQKINITDEKIVYEARENWHKDKLKIDRDKFFKAIIWMKENNFIPKGRGKLVDSKK